MKQLLAASALTLLLMPPPGYAAQTQAKPRPKPQPLTLTVDLTDRTGNPLEGVAVEAVGPVDRSGETDEKGRVLFRALQAGTYRLRFVREGFHTFEREVVLRAGQPATISVALTPAPAPGPPAPEPAPPPRPIPDGIPGEPVALSIPSFLERNLIRSEPARTSLLACAQGGTTRLVQLRDPLVDQRHDEVDEVLYVVAGSGTLRLAGAPVRALGAGYFVLVPRGSTYSLERQGRNPLVLLSVLIGAPCTEEDGANPAS